MRALLTLGLLCDVLWTATAVHLSVNSTSVKHNGVVQVVLTDLGDVNNVKSVFLGLFYPAEADTSYIGFVPNAQYTHPPFTKTAPLKWWPLSEQKANSDGSMTINVVVEDFLSGSCKLALLDEGEEYSVLAKSPKIIFSDDPSTPRNVHLYRTSNSKSEMGLIMQTAWENQHGELVLKWGTSPNSLTEHSSIFTSATHTAADMCGSPANETWAFFPPFFWHSSVMTGLEPGKLFYYSVGNKTSGVFTPVTSFVVTPPTHQDTRIILVADLGTSDYDGGVTNLNMPSSLSTASLISREVSSKAHTASPYSLLLHIGDVAYSAGYLIKWGLFTSMLERQRLGTSFPYMVNQGNHERDFPSSGSGSDLYPTSKDSGGECGRPTSLRFPSPALASYDTAGWYAFEHGPAMVVMLNSEAKVDESSPQYKFLEETLRGVDRSLTPWVIVASHRPLYFVYANGGMTDPVFAVLEDLLSRYSVDLFLAGHVHNTFASKPVLRGSVMQQGVRYLGIGNGGADLDLVGNSTNSPSWVAYQESTHGFATLSFEQQASVMRIQFISDQQGGKLGYEEVVINRQGK